MAMIFGSLAMAATSVSSALLSGWRAVLNKRWRGNDRWKGLAMVAALHLLQPLSRTVGRIKGRRVLKTSHLHFPDSDLLEGDLAKRDIWLQRLMAHMRSCGWVVRPCSEWDNGDIEVLGPGPFTLKLTSVYEEDLQRALHYIRYRVDYKMKLHAPIVVAFLMASLVGITQALYLVPLAIPIVIVLSKYVNARKQMIQAVSQMAMECGWPIGMPKAKVYY
jgi:hypothetical protein